MSLLYILLKDVLISLGHFRLYKAMQQGHEYMVYL